MKKSYLLLGMFVLLFLVSFVNAGELKNDLSEIISETPAGEEVSVVILFEDRPTPSDISVIRSDGASINHQYDIINAVSARVPSQAAEQIANRAFVKLVEPDYEVKLVLDESVPQIKGDLVWDSNVTGKDIDVAVIDTGIHDEHPALSVLNEIDYTGEGTDDLHGHGTHVAGIIASSDSNYRGVAYDSNLLNVKVLNQDGSGSGSNVIKGIEWAVDNGAEVISMSLGASIDNCDGSDAISQAVDKAVSQGVVAVVAAGNSGPDSGTITTPGCSKDGITIGAVDGNDEITSWSSRGPTDDGRVKPDLVAPGVGITSTWIDNSFNSISGTSMSTPHVSGVVALLLETDSTLTPEEIKNVLKSNALDLGLDENSQGEGRVDAYESYLSLTNTTEEPSNDTNETEPIEEDEPKEEEDKTKKSPPGLERRLEKGKGRPGSIGYGLSIAGERIRLAFTFNNAKKSELYLNFAERRLSESLEVSEEEERKELIEKYEEDLEKSREVAKRAKERGRNTTQVEEKIAEATIIHEEALKEVLERVPEQAKPSIERAINSSRRGNEEALNALKNSSPEKASELQFQIAERKLNQAREKALEGDSEEVDELIREYEERINESERVVESTSDHLVILGEIYNEVPETARPGIERAIENNVRERSFDNGNEEENETEEPSNNVSVNEEKDIEKSLNGLDDPAKTKIKEVEEKVKSESKGNAPNTPSSSSSSASGSSGSSNSASGSAGSKAANNAR